MSETGGQNIDNFGMTAPEDPRIIGEPSSWGTLVFEGQIISFGVVKMTGAEIIQIPEDDMIFISSDFQPNGPEFPGKNDLPTQSQRIIMHVKEQQRLAGKTERGTGRIALTSREVIMQDPLVRKRAPADNHEQLSLWELRPTN
jgi:hypothetical protein